MKPFAQLLSAALLLAVPSSRLAAQEASAHGPLDNPFFAFDNGVGRAELGPDQQAALLKELGYDGIGYTGTDNLAARMRAFDRQELKIFSLYVGARVGPDGPQYDEHLADAILALRGRDTILWLFIQGKATDAEQQAVAVTREIADLAAAASLRVALYPHYGFYVDRVEAAVRVAKKVERDNVGVTFNLCHFLRLGDQPNLDLRLRESLPYLSLVSINGADREGGWDRLIQTLDRGAYDVYGFLRKLKALGYDGPIGLQCYNVPGDPRENLRRSMAAWKQFGRRLEEDAKP